MIRGLQTIGKLSFGVLLQQLLQYFYPQNTEPCIRQFVPEKYLDTLLDSLYLPQVSYLLDLPLIHLLFWKIYR